MYSNCGVNPMCIYCSVCSKTSRPFTCNKIAKKHGDFSNCFLFIFHLVAMKYNDNHLKYPDRDTWHALGQSGQYYFGTDITGAKSWQCKFAGLTIYGLKSRDEAIAKIRELRNEKLQSDFYSIANIEK